MKEPLWITLAHSLPWSGLALRFIAWVRSWRTKPDPLAGLNRAQRRALTFTKPGEQRMRLERTALMAAKRKARKRKSDGGAKYRRAFYAGFERGQIETIEELRKRLEKKAKAAPQATKVA